MRLPFVHPKDAADGAGYDIYEEMYRQAEEMRRRREALTRDAIHETRVMSGKEAADRQGRRRRRKRGGGGWW